MGLDWSVWWPVFSAQGWDTDVAGELLAQLEAALFEKLDGAAPATPERDAWG